MTIKFTPGGARYKPFNLAAALAGKPVISVPKGRKVTGIAHFPLMVESSRVVYTIEGPDSDFLRVCKESGQLGTEDVLGMVVEERTVYIPVKIAPNGKVVTPCHGTYEDKGIAESLWPDCQIHEFKLYA